ncbi:MAG: transposase [Bacteroidota bacterium]
MTSKLNKLSELEDVLCNIENTNKGVLGFLNNFKISQLLRPFNDVKSKGFEVGTLIIALCLYRIKGCSIWAMQRLGGNIFFEGDENSIYRLMNNPRMKWRKLLMSFARQFVSLTQKNGEAQNEIKCFVLDDTDLEKTGKTIEFIGRIFSHVTHRYIFGFKLLVLCFWDGKSLITADFSLHREKGKQGNYGISQKEKNAQFRKKRDKKAASAKRVQELDMKKTDVAISMVKRAVKNGLIASYILMDSWFTNDGVIKAIRAIGDRTLHVLGMCKLDKRKYEVNGKEKNARQIITCKQRKHGKYSRKHKSHYIPVVVNYKGTMVKLFFIRYHNSKDWTILLTTNLKLTFVQAIELYQIRWTIEVLFKECKQYLRLGACQNTDFDGQVADTTLVFITHTILSLQRRFQAYETMGELFREAQQKLLELNLWQRILKVFLKLIRQLIELFDIDIDQTIERVLQNDKANAQLMAIMEVIKDDYENDDFFTKFAA